MQCRSIAFAKEIHFFKKIIFMCTFPLFCSKQGSLCSLNIVASPNDLSIALLNRRNLKDNKSPISKGGKTNKKTKTNMQY